VEGPSGLLGISFQMETKPTEILSVKQSFIADTELAFVILTTCIPYVSQLGYLLNQHIRHSWFTPYVVTRYLSQLLKATGGGPFWSFWYLSPDGYKSCKHPVSETEHRISDKFEIQVFNPDILIVHLGDLSNQFI
jgi:hypothetical protein